MPGGETPHAGLGVLPTDGSVRNRDSHIEMRNSISDRTLPC
jgi:hypothetical protein